jgi:hypothetical protein
VIYWRNEILLTGRKKIYLYQIPRLTKEELRRKIFDSLTEQGFNVNGHIVPSSLNKNHFRSIQLHSRREQIQDQQNFLLRSKEKVSRYLVNGWDINPFEIQLELRVVEPGSIEETLFRWWNLSWWSVPYQKAYGRQIRLILWDKVHNAPFGLIGLQSPILRMAPRDNYLNIPKSELDIWINKSMQAQRLGALPPYNQLIGGKMVALTLSSTELYGIYRNKYAESTTVIKNRVIDPELLFITTTSAFGKSSIYNRLKYKNEVIAKSLGFTKGSGTFHIPGTLYQELKFLLEKNDIDTNTTFGYGPSRKMKLLDQAFAILGLRNYHYHNIQRELFLFPLVKNLHAVIQKKELPDLFDRPLESLFSYWKERWAIPRFERQNGWIDFDATKFINDKMKEISHG